MAAFRCYAPKSVVLSALRAAAERADVQVCHQFDAVLLESGAGFSAVRLHIDVFNDPHSKNCTQVRVEATTTREARLASCAYVVLGLTLFFGALHLVHMHRIALDLVAIGLLIPAGLLLFTVYKSLRSLRKQSFATVSSLICAIRSSFKVIQLTPLYGAEPAGPLPAALIMAFVFGLIVLQLFLTFGPTIAALVALPFLVVCTYAALSACYPLGWRRALAELQLRWTLHSLWPWMPLVVLLIPTSAQSAGFLGLPKMDSMADFFDVLPVGFSYFADASVNPEDTAKKAVKSFHQQNAIELSIPVERIPLRGWFLSALAVTLWVMLSIPLLAILFRRDLSSLEAWFLTRISSEQTDKAVVPSSDSPIRSFSGHFPIVGFGLACGVIHWLTAAVAVDVVAFLFTGRCFIIRGLGWPFAMLQVNVEEMYGSRRVALMARVALLPLAVPGLLCIAASLRRLGTVAGREMQYLRRRRTSRMVPEGVLAFLASASAASAVAPPLVRLQRGARVVVHSSSSLFGLGSTITVSDGCLDRFTQEELYALLAHEIGHAMGDARKLAWLKACSLLLLSPLYYLVLLYDFAGAERRADQHVVSLMGSAEPLVNALVKLVVCGAVGNFKPSWLNTPTIHGRPTISFRRIRQTLSLVFDNSVIGAAYPPVSERIAYVRSLSKPTSLIGSMKHE